MRHAYRRQPECLTEQYADVLLKDTNTYESNCTWNVPR